MQCKSIDERVGYISIADLDRLTLDELIGQLETFREADKEIYFDYDYDSYLEVRARYKETEEQAKDRARKEREAKEAEEERNQLKELEEYHKLRYKFDPTYRTKVEEEEQKKNQRMDDIGRQLLDIAEQDKQENNNNE